MNSLYGLKARVPAGVDPYTPMLLSVGNEKKEKREWRAVGAKAGDFSGGLFRSYDLNHCIRGTWTEWMIFENIRSGSLRQVRNGKVQPVSAGVIR